MRPAAVFPSASTVRWRSSRGTPTSALNLGTVAGFGKAFSSGARLVAGFRQAMDGEEITVFGDGTQLRDFTYVDDVVDAFLMAGASDAANGQVFNVGAIEPISLREVTELLIEIAGTGSFRLQPFPPERKVIDIGSIYVDDRKLRRVLKWQPKVDLREGLKRTVEFYRAHRAQYWATPEPAIA